MGDRRGINGKSLGRRGNSDGQPALVYAYNMEVGDTEIVLVDSAPFAFNFLFNTGVDNGTVGSPVVSFRKNGVVFATSQAGGGVGTFKGTTYALSAAEDRMFEKGDKFSITSDGSANVSGAFFCVKI